MLLSGCDDLKLSSDWRECPVTIDAKYSDWGSSQSYYNEKERVVINLLNDSDYLYICLITKNRKIESKLMESGFVAWFDPQGGKNKIFGIRFPIGLRSMGIALSEDKRDESRDWRNQEDMSGLIDRDKERLTDIKFNKRLEALEGLQERLEILKGPLMDGKGKGKHDRPPHPVEAGKERDTKKKEGFLKDDPKELSLEEACKLGIEAKVGRENDYFVYELKVPLVKSANRPYAIEIKPDKPIGLGLEITMAGMGGMKEEFRGPVPGGDMEPSGRYHGDRFQLWATVVLSSNQVNQKEE